MESLFHALGLASKHPPSPSSLIQFAQHQPVLEHGNGPDAADKFQASNLPVLH